MANKPSGAQDPGKSKTHSEPEIDYSPKTGTRGENLLFGAKMFAVAAFLLGLLWIVKNYVNG
jgi:hypothetical protein